MNPPLRGAADVSAIKAGLADGTIDAIASDHAPHSLEEKQVEFNAAPPGMIGVETLLPLTLTNLVQPGTVTLQRAIELLTVDPANILGIRAGSLAAGERADVVVFDPERTWEVTRDWFLSRSKNSPFIGEQLRGRVTLTIARGEIVFEEGEWTARGDAGDTGEEDERGAREFSLHS